MTRFFCLASGSLSRKKVLERADIRFETIPPEIEEIYSGESPLIYVKTLARKKAEAVLDKTNAEIIVAADSIVVFDGEIIEKPKDTEDAVEILMKLQGNSHQFLTGIHVIDTQNKQSITKIEITEVKFTPMNSNLIKAYVKKFQPFSFAGGYDNGISSWFIESIKGSQSNLMGLPMTTLRSIIEDFGYIWFDFIAS